VGQELPRRRLDIRDFDAVIRDVEALAAGGYDRAGRWDLAQVCGHLAEWMRYPLDGFPRPPLPIRLMLGTLRTTIGRRKLRTIVETRSMKSGAPTLRESVPAPGGDEAAAVERLRQAVARFRAHAGPLHPSPLFGVMDHQTATQLQLVHCAHHLSALIPRGR
jgi:hypothetical protein